MERRALALALALALPASSSPASEAPRGRGTMRSMVEGASAHAAAIHASFPISNAPSTTLRVVPLPRRLAAGEDIRTIDNLPRDVARSITACWKPPHEGDEVTLRMSFRRDGSVFGKPRITYIRAPGGADGAAELANSIYAAVAACSPLRFTPSLGAAIAGRNFLIRFVALRKEQRAAL